jgi:hypothetical protein
MATESTRNRHTNMGFGVTLGALFDETTTKLLDELIKESRKEIFESKADSINDKK